MFYCPAKETTCPIGFLRQFYLRAPKSLYFEKCIFIDHTQIMKIKTHNWTAPRIMHYISFALHFICTTFALHLKIMPHQHKMHDMSQFKCHALNCFYFMKCKCNAKSLLQPVFCVFRTTFTMPGRNPPTSMRHGKGFTKAETTTLLKTIEQILPIDVEGWNEVHDIFNSKHSPRGVEGLKRKFNKLTDRIPTKKSLV